VKDWLAGDDVVGIVGLALSTEVDTAEFELPPNAYTVDCRKVLVTKSVISSMPINRAFFPTYLVLDI
jgi:hypothetical protein